MSLPRALRSASAAIWSACKSIDLEDCTLVAGYAMIGYGFSLIDPAYGYIAPGTLIVLPRVVRTLLVIRPSQQAGERQWAS